MRKNENGMYTYLDVPSKYNCVYKRLLIKLSDLGAVSYTHLDVYKRQ